MRSESNASVKMTDQCNVSHSSIYKDIFYIAQMGDYGKGYLESVQVSCDSLMGVDQTSYCVTWGEEGGLRWPELAIRDIAP